MDPASFIEDKIRIESVTKGIRTKEFFYDYDKLRCGYVTESQFFRVLWENFNLQFSNQERNVLFDKYNLKNDGRMNYRKFCEIINQEHNSQNIQIDPRCQTTSVKQWHGNDGSTCPLNPAKEKFVNNVLKQIQRFYHTQQINFRALCSQYDLHKKGLITISQFFRAFLKPTNFLDEDIALLVDKYHDPTSPSLFNYKNMANDMDALQQTVEEASREKPNMLPFENNCTRKSFEIKDIGSLINKLRIATYKYQIRTTEFFRDYDYLRTGCVTYSQFCSALSLALGKEAKLSEDELFHIASYYEIDKDRVNYRHLCEELEFAFNVADLEKKPTTITYRPPLGALGRALQILSEEEEIKVEKILNFLIEEINTRRPALYQFFQDFETGGTNTRTVTANQFSRVLAQVNFNLNEQEINLLCRKFKMSDSDLINYPGFVQSVDIGFLNYRREVESSECEQVKPSCDPCKLEPVVVDYDSLIQKLRSYILINRLSIYDFFRDYDSLRSGLITKSQFRRALDLIGFGSLGGFNISEAQFNAIARSYEDPNNPDHILWNVFKQDMDIVFTIPNLERNPSAKVPSSEIFVTPTSGTMNWDFATDEMKIRFEKLIKSMQQFINYRNVDILSIFRMFDKLRHGHVTRSKFRQVLEISEFKCTEDDFMTLESKYYDDEGVNYTKFLEDLLPKTQTENDSLFLKRMELMRFVNCEKNIEDKNITADFPTIIEKMKTKLLKQNVRTKDWFKVHDKLNHGIISSANFRRALDQCKFDLNESEVCKLEEQYEVKHLKNGDFCWINYLQLVDELESTFIIKDLEKMPTNNEQLFRPVPKLQNNQLLAEEEEQLNACLMLLAKKIKVLRPTMSFFFKDFDVTNNGSITQSQFRRVLTELTLNSEVSNENIWNFLYKKFRTQLGGHDNVDYLLFSKLIDHLILTLAQKS